MLMKSGPASVGQQHQSSATLAAKAAKVAVVHQALAVKAAAITSPQTKNRSNPQFLFDPFYFPDIRTTS
jgi:hypothetical protein